jgi:hypothetical protein
MPTLPDAVMPTLPDAVMPTLPDAWRSVIEFSNWTYGHTATQEVWFDYGLNAVRIDDLHGHLTTTHLYKYDEERLYEYRNNLPHSYQCGYMSIYGNN